MTPPISVSELLLDPRIIPAIIAALVAFSINLIIPLYREWRKESTSRKNLMRMIYEDVNERTTQLNNTIPGLSKAIEIAKKDDTYLPVIIYTSGEEIFSLKDEKWLIPREYSQSIVKFYSQAKGLVDLVSFLSVSNFEALPRHRKIAVLETVVNRMKEGTITGTSLMSIIIANGWVKKQ